MYFIKKITQTVIKEYNFISNVPLYVNHTYHSRSFNFLSLLNCKPKIKDSRRFFLCKSYSNSHVQNESLNSIKLMKSLPQYESKVSSLFDVSTNEKPNEMFIKTLQNASSVNWNVRNVNDSVSTFVRISYDYKNISKSILNENIKCLVTAIHNNLDELSDDCLFSLLEVLFLWNDTYSFSTENTINAQLKSKIDKTCVNRRKKWPIDQQFLVANYFFLLTWTRSSRYTETVLEDMVHGFIQLKKENTVLFLFYASLNKRFPMKLNRKDLNLSLISLTQSLLIEELVIISQAFYRTGARPLPQLLDKTLLELCKPTTFKLTSVSLNALLKLVKIKKLNYNEARKLYESLDPYLDKCDFFTLLTVHEVGHSSRLYNFYVLGHIEKVIEGYICNIRIKDICRILYAMEKTKMLVDSSFLKLIANKMHQKEFLISLLEYPEHYVQCVSSLTSLGHLNESLMLTALHYNTIDLIQMRDSIEKSAYDLLNIHYTLQIEYPQFSNIQLGNSVCYILSEIYQNFLLKSQKRKNEQTINTLENIIINYLEGKVYCKKMIILPHFKGEDFVFCTNANGDAVKLPDDYVNLPKYSLKHPESFLRKNLKWNVVVPLFGHDYFYNYEDNKRYKFNFVTRKINQLHKLGYNTIQINTFNMKNVEDRISLALKKRGGKLEIN